MNMTEFVITIERMVGASFMVEVKENDTVKSLKMKIFKILSIVMEKHQVMVMEHQGQLMMDDKTLADYNVKEGSIIHLSICSTGLKLWKSESSPT